MTITKGTRMTTTTLPSVRQQVKNWASGRSAKDAEAPPRETLDVRALEVLGRVGRSSFVRTKDGREAKLKGPARPDQIEQAPPGAVLVRQSARSDDGRTRTDTYIGTEVAAGTFEKLQRQKTYRGPKQRPAGPLDGLAELRTPANRRLVQLGPDDDSPAGIIMGALSKRPLLLMTDSRATPMTVRRLIEMANAEGANLRVHNGHVLADWNKVKQQRALLVGAWSLVEAHVLGQPLRCSYEHDGEAPPAATLDPVGTPLCNACIGWDDAV